MPHRHPYALIALLGIVLLGIPAPQPAAAVTPGEAIPSLGDTLEVEQWKVLGPVPLGPRDGGVEPVDAMRPGGSWPPDLDARIPSWLVPGGWVSWDSLPDSAIGERGRISVEWPELNWMDRMDEWGFPGLLNCGYLYAQFTVPAACRALAIIPHTSSFRLNGDWFPGAPYAMEPNRVPVILKTGVNQILLRFSGYGTNLWGTFRLTPLPGSLWLDGNDAIIPDIISGRDLDAPIGIPVWNTTTEWSGPVKLDAVVPGLGSVGTRELAGIASLSIRKPDIPVKIKWQSIAPLLEHSTDETDGENDASEEKMLQLVITARSIPTVTDGENVAAVPETLDIPIRLPQDARRVTFISKQDWSPQFFGLLPPLITSSTDSMALILSIHGASVDALGQARAYGAKDWAYLVAPTNRRPYGFDWHDWGRRDALEVLDIVLKTYPIDPDRVCLTGHSMGGHGAWAIGIHHFDRFAALAPSAGWSHFDLYVPMTLRRGALMGDPVMESLWHRMRIGDRVPLHIGNVKNLPVFVLHGGADDNVPPTHGRFLSAELQQQGGEVEYVEVPGKGHWWDDDSGKPGTACVDHPEMMALFREARRKPQPTEVEFTICDMTVDGGTRHWVEVLEQIEPLRKSRVKVKATGWGRMEIETENIAALALRPEFWLENKNLKETPGKRNRSIWHLVVNNQILDVKKPSLPLVLVRQAQKGPNWFSKSKGVHWKSIPPTSSRGKDLLNPPEPGRLHGLKAGFMSPFILVYGASGTDEETAAGLHVARILARNWAYRGNGDAPVLSDRDILKMQANHPQLYFEGHDESSYRLVLIGNGESNALIGELPRESIIHVGRNRIDIREGAQWIGPAAEMGGSGILNGEFSVTALIPDPLNPDKVSCLFGGTTAGAILRSASVNPFYAGAGWPDFLLFDQSFQKLGWAGFYGAGLWIGK